MTVVEMTAECGVLVRLTTAERDFLDELNDAAVYAPPEDRCALSLGHPGAHAACVQSQRGSDDTANPATSWWLVWGEGTRILLPHTKECETADLIWPGERCFLYAGHVGACKFRQPPDWLPDE